MNKVLFCALSLLFLGMGCNKGTQDKSLNDPGTERQLDKSEVSIIKKFCSAVETRRKVISSSKINDQINLTIKSNTCDVPDFETNTYTAIYDQDLSGKLYFQSAGQLCSRVIWNDQVDPIKTYCENIKSGEKSDRVTIDLSLYVFDIKNSNGQFLANIYNYSIDANDSNVTTFENGHQLYTTSLTSSSTYGRVVNYRIESQCSGTSFIKTCEQKFD